MNNLQGGMQEKNEKGINIVDLVEMKFQDTIRIIKEGKERFDSNDELGMNYKLDTMIDLLSQTKMVVFKYIDKISHMSPEEKAMASVVHAEDKKIFDEIESEIQDELGTKKKELGTKLGIGKPLAEDGVSRDVLDALPSCKCGGRPMWPDLGFFLYNEKNGEHDVIPYVLQCNRCMRKVGYIDMSACLQKWIDASVDPKANLDFLTYDESDHMEGQV